MSTLDPYKRSPSARWVLAPPTITPPAQGHTRQSPEATIRLALRNREMRRPLPATLRYRGGNEAWVQIEARGTVYRFPGHTCLYDVLGIICKAIPLAD